MLSGNASIMGRCQSLASLQVWPSCAATQCLLALQPQNIAHHGWLASWSSPFGLLLFGCYAWPAGTEALVLAVAGGQKRAEARHKSASADVTALTNARFLPLLCVLVLVCAGRCHRSCQQQLGVVICAVHCSHVCARSRQEMSQKSADSIERCWLGQGSTSAWILLGGLGTHEDRGSVEVGGQQDDEEERRRGVDHHHQQLGMGWAVPPTSSTTKYGKYRYIM